jgi:tetratricopeptide (TPR) repeat protein
MNSYDNNRLLKEARELMKAGRRLKRGAKLRSDTIKIKEKFDSALEKLAEVPEDLCYEETAHCKMQIGWCLMNHGHLYGDKTYYRDAIIVLKEALHLFVTLGNAPIDQAECKETIGKCYGYLGQMDDSAEWQVSAFDQLIETDSLEMRKRALKNIQDAGGFEEYIKQTSSPPKKKRQWWKFWR